MEKKQVQEQAKIVETTAVMRLYEFELDNGEIRRSVSVKLPNPFGDLYFVDIPISPRWDSAKGHIDYYGRKALQSVPEIEFPVEIRATTYFSKKKKCNVTYAGIYAPSPFASNYEIEFAVKERYSSVYRDLANERLGITNSAADDTPTAPDKDEDDIGL